MQFFHCGSYEMSAVCILLLFTMNQCCISEFILNGVSVPVNAAWQSSITNTAVSPEFHCKAHHLETAGSGGETG